MQKAQEDEMLALFNAVPKKKEEVVQKEDELDPDTGPTFTDITQEIEYQRANVVAKTRITDAVFQCASASRRLPPALNVLCSCCAPCCGDCPRMSPVRSRVRSLPFSRALMPHIDFSNPRIWLAASSGHLS